METVGIVGLGKMGSALLHRWRLAGVTPTVYDIAPAAVEAAVAQGALAAESPAAVARAALLIQIVVDNDAQVRDVALGADGVLAGARHGALVLLHSTVHPRTTRQVAEAAAARGVGVIDACMIGVPRVVRAGQVSFAVGGPPELVERARPALLQLGQRVLHMGPLGAGNVAKLAKNLVSGAEKVIIYEAIAMAEAAGLRYPAVLELMRTVYSGSVLEQWEEAFDPSGSNPQPIISPNIAEKDLALACQVGREHEVPMPVSEQLAAEAWRLYALRRQD